MYLIGENKVIQIQFFIYFLAKENCKPCDELEKHVESLQEDFQKHMNALSVKVSNSHMARLYNPAKEPALVFFRHGVPLLFSGKKKLS